MSGAQGDRRRGSQPVEVLHELAEKLQLLQRRHDEIEEHGLAREDRIERSLASFENALHALTDRINALERREGVR